MSTLNAKGEVCDLLDVSQFIPGRSEDECCDYASALLKYAGEPGHGPTGTVLAASNLAQYWYGRLEGSTSASNTAGTTLPQLYTMLSGMGLGYHPLIVSVQAVKDALAQGYPVLACGAETGMHDLALGDVVPYAWPPSGNHAIVVSGVAADGNLLVHDTASIAATGVRPGPRTYDASKLQLVSATAVVLPWMNEARGVPRGWHDDGTILTAPNGIGIADTFGNGPRYDFRSLVLASHWNADNWPLDEAHEVGQLEASNPGLGGGVQQFFNEDVLEYTKERGAFLMYAGKELLKARQQAVAYYSALEQAKDDYAILQAARPDSALQAKIAAALKDLS